MAGEQRSSERSFCIIEHSFTTHGAGPGGADALAPHWTRTQSGQFELSLSLRERAGFFLIPKSVWVEACVFGSIIIICNSLFAPRDIGWLNLSPTPYFLLPILLGCRYGF